MTLWEDALDRHQQLRGTFDDLEGVVSEYQQTFGEASRYAEFFPEVVLGAIYLDIAQDPLTAPGGVYGFGLWSGGGPSPVAAVFVQPGLAPPGGAPLHATPLASPDLARQFPWPRRALAVAIPPPQLNAGARLRQSAAPNARVVVGSQRATLGLPISTYDCSRGFTTAGHAAPITPARVRGDAGEVVGLIKHAVHLDNAPPDRPTADVALVELAPDCPEQVAPLGAPLDAAREIDKVSILGLGSAAASWIRGLSPSFALRPGIARWGEVAITADAISAPGDSGSLVVRDDGAVLGQIVAGHQGVYSLVQDIEYCLQELGAHIR